jgi:hypothetical protein
MFDSEFRRRLPLFVLIALLAAIGVYLLFPPQAPEPLADATRPLPSPSATSVTPPDTSIPPVPTATMIPPTPSAEPTLTPPGSLSEGGIDLGNGVQLMLVQIEREEPPSTTFRIAWAQLLGDTAAPIEPFNQAVISRVTDEMEQFRLDVGDYSLGEGGDLWISTTVPFASDRLVSVRMEISPYAFGSAHPADLYYTINYDLEAGRVLALADLFQPGANYLRVLSDYCTNDIERHGVPVEMQGALPLPENYETHWNFDPEGLLITFDACGVSPCAVGPQSVVVPYALLRDIAAQDGPLALFLP